MRRLKRDVTAEPVSRDQILRSEIIVFPVQLTTSRIDNLTRLIHTLLYVCDDHTRQPPFRRLRFFLEGFPLSSACVHIRLQSYYSSEWSGMKSAGGNNSGVAC